MSNKFKKLYRISHTYEKREIVFLLLSLFMVCLVTVFYTFHYLLDRSYFFAAAEVATLIIAGYSLYFLLNGKKDKATNLLFPIFGNLNLLRIMILYAYFDYDRFPFPIEIFYCFQLMIILAVAYFCRKKVYLFITILFALTNNTIYLLNFSKDILHAGIISTLLFIIVPLLFSLHIMQNKKLLENFYINNLNKNREVNHRIKNHLSLLSSLIALKAFDKTQSLEVYSHEISAAVTSFTAIYDKLLYSEDMHKLNLYEYFKSILDEYSTNFSISSTLTFTEKNFIVDSEKVANLGMILSELITNSIKHTNKNKLEIYMTIEIKKDILSIVYTDNGEISGLSEKQSDYSFGETIIKSIVTDTFKGKYHVLNSEGYTNVITLPIEALTT